MDNDEFVERFGKIAIAIAELPDDLFGASEPGVPNAVRSEVLKRATLHLKEYEELLPILSEGRRAMAIERCGADVARIHSFMRKLEDLK